jgi:hypothetical protein
LVFKAVMCHVPGGPAGRRGFLALTGPCRHLGLARKSLVQTGQNIKSPFPTVRFRARSKPDWPDYWDPCEVWNQELLTQVNAHRYWLKFAQDACFLTHTPQQNGLFLSNKESMGPRSAASIFS